MTVGNAFHAMLGGVALVLTAAGGGAAAQEQAGLNHAGVIARYDARIPMKDGVLLSAKIFRPMGTGRHPAVLTQTPYGKDSSGGQAAAYVRRGYAVVTVDVRGRYDSQGEFKPFHDAADGSEVLNWIAAQPWSNGKAVTTGGSYGGNAQWNLWRERNPRHAAIVSYVGPADGFGDFFSFNGVPKLDLMYTWMMLVNGRVNHPKEIKGDSVEMTLPAYENDPAFNKQIRSIKGHE